MYILTDFEKNNDKIYNKIKNQLWTKEQKKIFWFYEKHFNFYEKNCELNCY